MSEIRTPVVLATGSNGMIGSQVVGKLLDKGYRVVGIDRSENRIDTGSYIHRQIDLSDTAAVEDVFSNNPITHVIHLAALAHTTGETNLSCERYYHINVECAKNIFTAAATRHIPIMFSSTADVYGITNGVVDIDYDCKPISSYAKSKYVAEGELKRICADYDGRDNKKCHYTIMRFAPVYTENCKRDIQKRYYIKYPNWAYRIGKGVEYEALHIDNVIKVILYWIDNATGARTINVKNPQLMNTKDMIAAEKAERRARHVIWIPRWIVVVGYKVIKLIAGSDSNFTYLVNKVINPLRTE